MVAIGLCGDLWYEENITRLNELEPDIVWWPVYTDYNYLEWNNTVKFEYAKQAGKINAPVFMSIRYAWINPIIAKLPKAVLLCLIRAS